MKKNAFMLIESLVALSLLITISFSFLRLLNQQYIEKEAYEQRIAVEEAMQQKIRHPKQKVYVHPWNEEVYYEKNRDYIKVAAEINGQRYKHTVWCHVR